jgi:H+/Cl- antiporter ClcA
MFDYILISSIDFRYALCSSDSSGLSLLLWIVSAVVLLLIATSVGHFLTPETDGSGIPELKTVISGINIYRYFSLEAFIGKTIALYAAIVSGNRINLIQVLALAKSGLMFIFQQLSVADC